jgi:hypothetical protein
MSLLKATPRTPGVKFVSFDGKTPGIGYKDMVVLDWMEEQHSSTFVDEGPGEPLYWAAKGEEGNITKNTTTKSVSSAGVPLKPVMFQPVLVWVPGPDGQGLRDPEIEGDFGVRILAFGAYKDITKKMGAAMEQGGRTTGILELGDVIGVQWVAKDGRRKIYAAQFQAATEESATLAAKAKAKFDTWQESRQREADDNPSVLSAAASDSADDPRGWSTGGAATPEPVGAATGGGLFDAPF